MKPIKISMGFTLIEMMVVISIIGILASIAVPSFQSLVRNQRVKNASFNLYSSLMVARSEAIKRNANVTVTPTSGSWQNGWQITADAGATVLKNQDALAGIAVTGATSLTYTRTGRLSAAVTPLEINIDPTDAAYIRCIKIDLSGLPRTIKGACS